EARVDRDARDSVGFAQNRLRGFVDRRHNDTAYRQVVFRREFEVALVVARRAEQRSGAVIHQHEVRDIDWHTPLGIERMDRLDGGAIAYLLLRLDLGQAGAPALAFGDELGP